MSPAIADLLTEAEGATPTKRRRGRWIEAYTVFEKLRMRNFAVDEAVNWLVDRGAIPRADRTKARNAFMQLKTRRNRTEGKMQ